MKIVSRQEAVSFYNDDGVLIASFNKFYNKIYTGKMLRVSELEEIKKYLDKKKHKAYTVFGMSEPIDDGDAGEVEIEVSELDEETEKEKPKKKTVKAKTTRNKAKESVR